MELEEKIQGARLLIERLLRSYRRPFVMSSFGKDSMVLLDILKRMGVKLPILFHREAFFPQKYEFAERVIRENDYVVYDYPPLATGVIKNRGHLEVVNFYQVGPSHSYLPTGIRAPEPGKPFLCGLADLYRKPTGTFEFPWDLGFVGHKSSDVDPIFGPVPLAVDVKINPDSCDYGFPLRHLTDADVWDYHRQFAVPVNEKRYDPENGFKERDDITFNPDYHHACVRCMDRDEPATVECPKFQCQVPNVSTELRYIRPERPPHLAAVEGQPDRSPLLKALAARAARRLRMESEAQRCQTSTTK